VQGFELVLAVVDGVSSAVDCGGLEGGEGGGGHCGGLYRSLSCGGSCGIWNNLSGKDELLVRTGSEEDCATLRRIPEG
jgi:hypothetical protein